MIRRVLLAATVALAIAPIAAPRSAAAETTRVLVVVAGQPEGPGIIDYAGRTVERLLQHFDVVVERLPAAETRPEHVAGADRVVVVGADPSQQLPPAALGAIARFDVPTLWAGHGLDQMPVDVEERFGIAVGHAESGVSVVEIRYGERAFQTEPTDLHHVAVSSEAVEVLSQYVAVDGSTVPFIVRAGPLWFVNGIPEPSGNYPSEADAAFLILADALHEFVGETHEHRLRSVIRLEDVSAHIEPGRLRAQVEYLASAGVPYVLSVIPAQRLADGSLLELSDHAEFAAVLRWAQDHGGTVALHGYHHTFGTGEDYEFWDSVRDAPLLGETPEGYATKVEDGIRILRDVGLRPLLWETPHYAASPLAYEVFDSYFDVAIENREPISWLPYLTRNGRHRLIPENLGYVEASARPPSGETVEAQLERARVLKIVRDAWAIGFVHPVDVPVGRLKQLVEGLAARGYEPLDVRQLEPAVRYRYEPDPARSLIAALSIERELAPLVAESWLQHAVPITGAVLGLPWGTVLLTTFAALIVIRLRAQWSAMARPSESVVSGARHRARRSVSWSLVAAAVLLGSASIAVMVGLATADVPALTKPVEIADRAAIPPGVAERSSQPASTRPVETRGWEISMYFTAVEELRRGPPIPVHGCRTLECTDGTELLGSFGAEFVEAVRTEGTGRLSDPALDGREYLNWSGDGGFWLDHFPRDARGMILRPYQSVAASDDVPFDARVRLLECGVDEQSGSDIGAAVCATLASIDWVVRDRFEGDPGPRRLDLYIGEETAVALEDSSERLVHTRDAVVRVVSE